ncbi:uncharacterized protein LOC131471283 isoform X2 [Solea solea]|uniref:uncharacterized protein LOC131471283 isoform X2 n=1 Tax=Solea solea TaxID=90069 RepID=UPI00272B233F|nr:uncharacterized protein LOC131471283 isoform X2 [Solea solea]
MSRRKQRTMGIGGYITYSDCWCVIGPLAMMGDLMVFLHPLASIPKIRGGHLLPRLSWERPPSSVTLLSDFIPIRPVLDLSHNESARLAMDCLLSQGLEEYHQVLKAEGEADFLSEMEKKYVLENGRESNTADLGVSDDDDYKHLESWSAGSQSASMFTAAVSTGESPACKPMRRDEICASSELGEPRVELYFQSDNRAAGMKDLIRQFIRKAKTTLAIVVDSFTDIELLCDLLEASRKRNVSIHLLLDHLNLNMFVTMWQDLKLNGKKFPKLSVRSVDGQTYCAKTGMKLTGQIAESFIITDWAEVLTGSYSFSWLSWQVHRSLAVLINGSAVTPFLQEFHRLYFSSKPVPCFVTLITVPRTLSLYIQSHVAQNGNAGISELKSSRAKTMDLLSCTGDAEETQTTAKTPFSFNLKSMELERSKSDNHGAATHTKPLTPCLKPLLQQQCASVESPKQIVTSVSARQDTKTHVEKNQNQIQNHSKTRVSHNQLRSAIFNITTTTTGRNATGHESNCGHAANVKQPQRTVSYQSTSKNLHLDSDTLGIERLFICHRNRDRLKLPGMTAYLSAVRRQRNHSLNLKFKKEIQSDDNSKILSPPASQQKPAKSGRQFPLTYSLTGHTSGLQTKVSSLEIWPPPQLNWLLQRHTARPRPVARSRSFDTRNGTGGQPGCRPALSYITTSLRRSKSWTEKHSAGFKGQD